MQRSLGLGGEIDKIGTKKLTIRQDGGFMDIRKILLMHLPGKTLSKAGNKPVEAVKQGTQMERYDQILERIMVHHKSNVLLIGVL